MTYQVLLVPGGGRFTLANVHDQIWVRLAGSLCQTTKMNIPHNTIQFAFDVSCSFVLSSRVHLISFQHRNLGVLSTLRIGHKGHDQENGNVSREVTKWFLEEVRGNKSLFLRLPKSAQVLVRCELTGATYRFPCRGWFGRDIGDGSLERLLVAEPVPTNNEDNDVTPSSARPYGTIANVLQTHCFTR